ncbi:MAG: hypothetical protein PHS79_01460 [Patescibacteria group bacterium]|nr:hypothetical protein [Patescibacteria group bacterium]
MSDEDYEAAQQAAERGEVQPGELRDWGSVPPDPPEQTALPPLSHRSYAETTLSDEDYAEEQERVRQGLCPSGTFPHWDHEPLGKPRPMPK